eukprot:8867663-Heterocapsa_arctica.AAC.1
MFHKGPGAHPIVADGEALSGVGANEEREDLRGASSVAYECLVPVIEDVENAVHFPVWGQG